MAVAAAVETLEVTSGNPAEFTGGKFVIPSRSGGAGHEVRVKQAKDGSFYLTCGCPGGKFAFATKNPANRGRGCWAMQKVRKALGMPAIGTSTI